MDHDIRGPTNCETWLSFGILIPRFMYLRGDYYFWIHSVDCGKKTNNQTKKKATIKISSIIGQDYIFCNYF